jgi:uncharacterized membrane protein
MAKEMSDTVRDALGQVVRGAVKNAAQAASNGGGKNPLKRSKSPLSGVKGVAAGAGLAAAAPLAYKGVDKLRTGGIPKPSASKLVSKAGDQVGSKLKDTVSEKVDQAGGASGLVKDAASGLLPGGGGDSDGGSGGMPGVGKGRRMPVQQAIDVAVPLETAYNQWTQFEDWPNFMHRVTRVTQDDDCSLSFATKIWGKTKEFTADIETQRPDQRIKWRVSQGITHSGVVTFHELAPSLTRIEINLDIDPGSLIEKAARGMRHVKRAVRADLHRYKAFIEMQELETGAWRGVIEDGELVEPHDEEYDEERDYSEIEDAFDDSDDSDSDDSDSDDEEKEDGGKERDDSQRARTGRFQRQAESAGRGSRSAAASQSSSSREASDGSSKSSSKPRAKSGQSKSSNGSSASSRSSTRSRSGNGNGNGASSSKKRSSGSGSSSTRRKAASRS